MDCPLEYKKGENQTNVELMKEEDWWGQPPLLPAAAAAARGQRGVCDSSGTRFLLSCSRGALIVCCGLPSTVPFLPMRLC